MSCHSLLACRASVEKSADSLMGFPLCVSFHLYLVAFNVLSLCLVFVLLITLRLSVLLLGFILPGTLCFLDLVDYFLCMLGNFSAIISSNIFSGPFSLSSPSRNPIMQMLVHLMFSQRSCKLFSFIFILFSIFCYMAVLSTSVLQVIDLCFCLSYSAIDFF